MPRRSSLSYRAAIRLLARGNAQINRLDKAVTTGLVGGGLLTHGATLGLLGPKTALFQLVRDYTGNSAGRIRATGGQEYFDLQEASHNVLALSAFFDAFRNEIGPGFDLLELTDDEKTTAIAQGGRRRTLPQELESASFPMPSQTRGFDQVRRDVETAYTALYDATINFCEPLAAWSQVKRRTDLTTLRSRVVGGSMRLYDERFSRLCTDMPEFGHRTVRNSLEHQDGRLDALEGLSHELIRLVQGLSQVPPDGERQDVLQVLARSVSKVFRQPLFRVKDIDFPLRLPAVESGFVSPDFRIAEFQKGAEPERESWWQAQPRSNDLVGFLTGYLTDPASAHRPLLILGTPGAGKTLLTKVIVARLPVARFTPIVVPLRRTADRIRPVKQIEAALDQLMNEEIRWGDLRRSVKSTTVVVVFDGFDELVQATGTAHSRYIEHIADFQDEEWSVHGVSIIPIITSRMLVMERATVPAGTTLIRLEDLTDEQIGTWVKVVNEANEDRPKFRRFSAAELIESHGELVRQPLLLTLLALYHDEGWARSGRSISRSDLFTGLLTSFIRRQVAEKAPPDLSADEQGVLEHRLRRDLAITAFAMFNRNRDVVNGADLRADLNCFVTSVLGNSAYQSGDLLGPEQLITAAFFVVFGPDDVQGEEARRTYEFLHVTIGDFLIAEYVVDWLRELTKLRLTMDRGPGLGAQLNFGQLRALLSYQPLVKREAVVAFIGELSDRLLPDRGTIVDTIVGMLKDARQPTGIAGVETYRPCRYDAVRLLAAYTANLVSLAALLSGPGVPYQKLMDDETWTSTVRLWRAGLDEEGQLAMLSRLRRDGSGLIVSAANDQQWDSVAIAGEEARLLGDTTTYAYLRAGAATWREQEPESFDSGRFHAQVVSLATRRWPVPSLRYLTLYDEKRYGDLLMLAADRPESVSSTSATMILECLTVDGRQLPRDIVCGLTRVALRRLPNSVTAPPELIIACPYLIDEFPELLEKLGEPEEHAVLHALILWRGLQRLPAQYRQPVGKVLDDLKARLPELPLDRGLVSVEMAEHFAAARVGHRTAQWLLMELSEFGDMAWRLIEPRVMASLLADPVPDEFLDRAHLCRLLGEYLRTHGRSSSHTALQDALEELHDLVATMDGAA